MKLIFALRQYRTRMRDRLSQWKHRKWHTLDIRYDPERLRYYANYIYLWEYQSLYGLIRHFIPFREYL